MRKIVDMKPTPPFKIELSFPWLAVGTALVVATLLIFSVSNQYLAHFQKFYGPYFARNTEDTKKAFDLHLLFKYRKALYFTVAISICKSYGID